MSTQSNQSHLQSFAPPDDGTRDIQQGTWMYYDQAAIATGKSEKTLKRYVKKGALKSRRMGKQINSPVQVLLTEDFIASLNGPADQRIDDAEVLDDDMPDVDAAPESEATSRKTAESFSVDNTTDVERMMKLMVAEFATQLDKQKDMLFEMRLELEQKDAELRLLPDLKRQLEEKEKEAYLKSVALEKQIEALKEEQSKIVEELVHEKEVQSKSLTVLKEESENRAKLLEHLQAENERLRTAAETAKVKRTWWEWFLGKS
jgi:hypothetical protein